MEQISLPHIDFESAHISSSEFRMCDARFYDTRGNICYIHSQPLKKGGDNYLLYLVSRNTRGINSGSIKSMYAIGLCNKKPSMGQAEENSRVYFSIGPFKPIYERRKEVVDYCTKWSEDERDEEMELYLNNEGLFLLLQDN